MCVLWAVGAIGWWTVGLGLVLDAHELNHKVYGEWIDLRLSLDLLGPWHQLLCIACWWVP